MVRQEDIKVGMEITYSDILDTRNIYIVVSGMDDLNSDTKGIVEYIGEEQPDDGLELMRKGWIIFYITESELFGE